MGDEVIDGDNAVPTLHYVQGATTTGPESEDRGRTEGIFRAFRAHFGHDIKVIFRSEIRLSEVMTSMRRTPDANTGKVAGGERDHGATKPHKSLYLVVKRRQKTAPLGAVFGTLFHHTPNPPAWPL
jgi:hypothetical protein